MEIVVGKHSGFCSGVNYTVTKAAEELNKANDKIYCLGELVHNERVVENLKKNGMIFIQNIEEAPNNSKVVFRAHGEKKETYEKADEKGITIIDLTCGKIRVIRNKIKAKLEDSFIIIIGKRNHPETIGTVSYCGDNNFVIEKESDIEQAYVSFADSRLNKLYVVAQTTFSNTEFEKLTKKIEEVFHDAEIIIEKTICDSTEKRQKEVVELSKTVDEMIIVGGKNSSNTKELANLSEQKCNKVHLIQSVEDLKGVSFSDNKRIGIMAGASTPQILLDEIIEYLTFEAGEVKYTKGENVDYLQFKRLLEYPEIKHAYILKAHDMSFRLGTNFRHLESVKNNIEKVCNKLDIPLNTIIRPDYNHTANVRAVDFVDNSEEIPEISGKRFKDVDGLITDKTGITMMSTNADCNLILLYDPINKIVGNVHAGWRGTFEKIALNAINKMKEEYGSAPNDILCFLCPSIRKCHFEVDSDVKEWCERNFAYTNRLDEIIEKGEIKEGKQKYYIDTVLINKILLEEAGIPHKNIIDSGICSVCSSDKVHSKRAEGDYFGLGAAFIGRIN